MGWGKIYKKQTTSTGSGIKIGCWNKGGALQPLKEKINEVENLIKSNNFQILGVLEANFFEGNCVEDINIPGFTVYWDKGRKHQTRGNSRTVLFVDKDLSCKIRYDLMGENVPEVWAEIGEPRKKRSLLCLYYREFSEWGNRAETDSQNNQMERFKKWISNVENVIEEGRETWFLGDFNFDLSRRNDKTYDRRYIAQLAHEELIGRGLVQLIQGPTHRKNGSESTIDLFFTNEPRKISHCGRISTGSDHDCIWATRHSSFVPKKKEIIKRTFRNFNKELFLDEARQIIWTFDGCRSGDEVELNNRVEDLEDKIRLLIDKHAPVKIFKVDPQKINWVTEDLKKQIQARNDLRGRLDLYGGNSQQWRQWRCLQNKVNKNLKNAKQEFLKKRIAQKSENSKSLWDGVKAHLGWKGSGSPEAIMKDGEQITEPKKMSDAIQDSFQAKLKIVEESLGPTDGNYLQTLRNMTRGRCRTFSFENITREQVLKQIRASPNKASFGKDEISYEILKMVDIYIAKPLMEIFNFSTQIGKYPTRWSTAILKPLFKGGKDEKDPAAYRPVSLLCATSRVMEALLNDQMNKYAEQVGVLHHGVHGYREGMSTVTALIEIQSRQMKAVEEGKISSLCLLDVSSGFDSVNHIYLLRKLEMYGYDDKSLNWIASYLSNRSQIVQVQASMSRAERTHLGFPQGGPASPVLFREYSNDIPACICTENTQWTIGELEDKEELRHVGGNHHYDSPITRAVQQKSEASKTEDEKWDEHLRKTANNIDGWRKEKTGIGPEPKLLPDHDEDNGEATLYADDNSAGVTGTTKGELKLKTENMLGKIINHMRSNRLLIHPGKTKVMLFATPQKRSKNDLSFHVDVEGKNIQEKKSALLLGVILTNDFTWDNQVEETVSKCSNRLNGLYKVNRELNRQQKKALAEGAILSRIRYGIEVISSGSERCIKKLESMQSKAARFALGISRRDWSRTEGYFQLDWLTVPQMAIESSMRMFFRVIWNRKPLKLFKDIFDGELDRIIQLTDHQLEQMTKLCRKSWRIRVLSYSKIIPQELFKLDPSSPHFKSFLKSWIKEAIPKDGDFIFKGKCRAEKETDWLKLELEEWKKIVEHDERAQREAEQYI